MDAREILQKVNVIFADILKNQQLLLDRESNVTTIEGWDSFNHIKLILTIEKQFFLKFSSAEIQSWKNIGDLCDTIDRKLS